MLQAYKLGRMAMLLSIMLHALQWSMRRET